MMRFVLTLAAWMLLALLFVGVTRWIKNRSTTRPGAERPATAASGGAPLAGTAEPLPEILEPLRAKLEPHLASAAQLVPGGEPVARLGGLAHLPTGAEWPRSPARPMSFVAEVDLAALRRAVPGVAALLPEDGVLALFYDVEEMPWGYEPSHGAYFRLLHLTGELAPRRPPEGTTVYTERVLGARAVRLLPDPADLPPELGLDEEASDAYAELADALAGEPDHRVGGPPRWIQSDAREDAAVAMAGGATGAPEQPKRAGLGRASARIWRLLLQIDTDDAVGFMWGDAGRLYLLARDEDLRSRRFDRAWLVLQCY
jgi:uncharacterized protein YwqG